MKRNLIIAICVLVYWGCIVATSVMYGLASAAFVLVGSCASVLNTALLMLDGE